MGVPRRPWIPAFGDLCVTARQPLAAIALESAFRKVAIHTDLGYSEYVSGGFGVVEPPVPISNTEVKHSAPTILPWHRGGKIGHCQGLEARTSKAGLTFIRGLENPCKVLKGIPSAVEMC